jgi:hypothetical protein
MLVVTEADDTTPSLEEALNIKADLKRSIDELLSRTKKTSDDLGEEIIQDGIDFEKSRLSHVQRFNAAQAERLRIHEITKNKKVSTFELVKVQELIPGSPEGSEKRSREKLHVEISKLTSLDAENDRKTHKALFKGTDASDFVLDA